MPRSLRRRFALAVLAVVVLGACAGPSGSVDGASFELDPLEAERARQVVAVKRALVADERVDAAAIRVTVEAGADGKEALRLGGFVDDEQGRRRALAIARAAAADGRRVIDALEIR